MNAIQTIQVENIGSVTFVPSPRARRIVISVRPGRGIRVAIPRHSSLDAALDFVRQKERWLNKHLALISKHQDLKEAAVKDFQAMDKKEARKKITGRLAELAREHGFSYGKVSIRNQKTRWGSCSGRGNISLNIKLVMLPPELSDYVILHELVHTRIHDHSKKFWQELDKYTGNGKAKAKRMKEYGLGIL